MILYKYVCDNCALAFEQPVDCIADRDKPCEGGCIRCGGEIKRVITYGGFTVPEGGCGNAANGYSSTHGDSENFKAGRKIYR